MGHLRRWRGQALTGFFVCVVVVVSSTSLAFAAHPTALSARSLNATDTARLHYVPSKSEGSTLFEEGTAVGALAGTMRAHLRIETTFSGTFVLYTRSGTIKGHGTAKPSGSGRYESFSGALVVEGGTGRFAHARGRAGLYGVFDRQSFRLTVQTTGRLSY